MGTKLDDFITELEADAAAQGPEAVAELEAMRAHFRIARELVALRRDKHLTQSRLSELSGVGQSEISRIESGHANPTLGTLVALGAPLGATVSFTVLDAPMTPDASIH
jgi:DNA-binding XRE family transcriptional regulator